MEYNIDFDFLKDDDGFFDMHNDCPSIERQSNYESWWPVFCKRREFYENYLEKLLKIIFFIK